MPRTSMSGTCGDPPERASHEVLASGIARSTDPASPAARVSAAVAPHPAAVLALEGVVQDAAPQGRLRAGRVELDRAGEQLVEVGEALGPVDEGDDGACAWPVDPGVTSTSTTRRTRSGCVVGQRDRGQPAERHARPRPGRRARGPGSPRATSAALRRTPRLPSRGPVGVAVAGQVDGHERAGRGPCATVSQVWAFWAPPCSEHQLGRRVAPHQRARAGGRGPTSTSSRADRRRPVVGEPELLGVLVEEPELVVRDALATHRTVASVAVAGAACVRLSWAPPRRVIGPGLAGADEHDRAVLVEQPDRSPAICTSAVASARRPAPTSWSMTPSRLVAGHPGQAGRVDLQDAAVQRPRLHSALQPPSALKVPSSWNVTTGCVPGSTLTMASPLPQAHDVPRPDQLLGQVERTVGEPRRQAVLSTRRFAVGGVDRRHRPEGGQVVVLCRHDLRRAGPPAWRRARRSRSSRRLPIVNGAEVAVARARAGEHAVGAEVSETGERCRSRSASCPPGRAPIPGR